MVPMLRGHSSGVYRTSASARTKQGHVAITCLSPPRCHPLLVLQALPIKISKNALLEANHHDRRDQVYLYLSLIRSPKTFSPTWSSIMQFSSCLQTILSRYIKLYITSEKMAQRWSLCKCQRVSRCLPALLQISLRGERMLSSNMITGESQMFPDLPMPLL
jgi:hypothetical protein